MQQKLVLSGELLARFKAYFTKNSSWGCLHIVLDDFNVDDNSVLYCVKVARESGDVEGEALAGLLLEMSKTQRKKLPYCV